MSDVHDIYRVLYVTTSSHHKYFRLYMCLRMKRFFSNSCWINIYNNASEISLLEYPVTEKISGGGSKDLETPCYWNYFRWRIWKQPVTEIISGGGSKDLETPCNWNYFRWRIQGPGNTLLLKLFQVEDLETAFHWNYFRWRIQGSGNNL